MLRLHKKSFVLPSQATVLVPAYKLTWPDQIERLGAGMGGFNMPEPSWRAHIDHFIVARHDGRLDVLQRQVALPLGLSDRRVPACVHFLRTLAMSETVNSKAGPVRSRRNRISPDPTADTGWNVCLKPVPPLETSNLGKQA